MKKMTFFIGSMGRGGAERVISILANYFCNNGYKVDIVMLLHNMCDYEIDDKVSVHDFSEDKKSVASYFNVIKKIRSYVKREKPEIIVPFIRDINVLVCLALLGLKRDYRLIESERIDPSMAKNKSFIAKKLNSWAYSKADCIVFQTNRAMNYYHGKIKRKGIIIENPIALNIDRTEPSEKIIVTAGRLEPQKNQKMLITAFSNIAEKYPDYKLQIFGEGSLKESLNKYIKELGMENRVFLMGNRLDYPEYLARSEIFVLPSNYEGLSNALLEAMSAGIPCISTNCAGSDETIRNGENGMLVQIGDMNGLQEALDLLLSNEELRKKIGNAAKESVDDYRIENIIDRWSAVMEGIGEV